MAGSILYIPYTFILIVGLTVIGLIIRLKKSNRITYKFLVVSILIFVLFQFYFWNLDFNNYVKSYLFSDKSYECGYYSDDGDVLIPLPKRTVYKGKQDACSPFYSTYINEDYFLEFYQDEISSMKNKREVQNYKYVEKKNKKGFEIELSSGFRVDIFIRNDSEETQKGIISIDFTHN